ncbi:hypothetical protein CLV37_110137 [Kineococcus rhizosphaerae]|uniref:4-amino-4-deoxy-L-arabinose transferase-like glycosyltransferase n=1 Tax=Kineococcus rhizosphaerae TaxID=559628 RepID=A0A2T0R0C9_9ACTN|nr:hypothetical protein CLV37_110137 [Kineococcus rhizosphaerae]
MSSGVSTPATDEVRAVRSGRPVSRVGALVPALGVGVLAAATFALLRTALVDDAYITLAYARNLALHGTWGLLSDVQSNTATSPLWVLLLGAVTFVVRRPVVALGILHVLVAVALTLSLTATARRTRLPAWTGPVAAVAVGVNPLLLSSVGLESAFLVLLLSLLLLTAVQGRALPFGLVAGAVFLTRMDAGVVIAVVTLLTPAILRRVWVAVPAALVVVLPWMAWSWFVLGSAVPDTVVIKTLQKSWEQYDVTNGAQMYVEVYGLTAVLAFLPVVLGGIGWCVLAAFAWTGRRARDEGAPRLWPWLVTGIAGLAHYVALSALGVPPYHWYYAVLVALSTFTAVAALGVLFRSVEVRPVGLGAGLAAVVVLVASAGVDLRAGTPWRIAPIQTNWAEPSQYTQVALGVQQVLRERGGPQRVTSPGEVGHLAYVCDCVVDYFGDPARVQPMIDQVESEASPLGKRLLEWNFTHRDAGAAPVPVAGDLFRFDRGTEPPAARGLPTWPVTTTWDMPLSDIVLLPAGGL